MSTREPSAPADGTPPVEAPARTSPPESPAGRYPHPLIDRYASAEMADLFAPRTQALMWRDLWIALADEERALGAPIPEEAVAAMLEARDRVDLERIAEIERETRHDVMAHVHHFGEVAPAARGHIHLGATSAYVADNASLLQHRDGLRIVRRRLLGAIDALAGFARAHAGVPTLGYTHLQPAQPTTVGKRACLWLQDLLLDLEQVEAVLGELRLRGARGTTGTEASFLDLFEGDESRVEELNARLARRLGFAGTYDVVGQTYPRKIDHRCLSVLAGIGASTSRFGQDIRLLQSMGELEEPFGERQVGSSAMPYKRNPMRSERICALARHLCVLETDAAWTASVQGLERTLDDSANRRIALPEAYLCADAVLQLARNVAAGLVVREAVVRARLERELPFLVAERVLVAGVRRGGDRQELHERVRRHALAARERLAEGAADNDFLTRVAADPAFGLDEAELASLARPERLIGRAPRQTERFLTRKVEPRLREATAESGDEPVELRV
ncbi:MAG: adenylosuccinate lyase [Gemmatimonadota bacterium]